MNAGIDYGSGRTNINHETGIRYGAISCNDIAQALSDTDIEYDYGDARCPKCGQTATCSADLPEASEEWEIAKGACSDWGCLTCEYVFDASEACGDEAIGWHYDAEGYQIVNCLDNAAMILASPYYTLAAFCSPCVPGAGDLNNACDGGVKTYCLGHDWFEDCKAPYPVYSVATGAPVEAEVRS